MEVAALEPGAVVAGRYRVDERVGTGAWGEVWAAHDLVGGAKVAVKTLLAASVSDEEAVTRFRREAYFLARIRSDYVARVLDFIVDETFGLVLVMEFIDGEPLNAVLRTRKLTVEEAIELGADVAAGMVDLHAANVIHRDLKPANIILKPIGKGRTRAMIVDFSLSRLGAKGAGEGSITEITKSNMALGTLPYMAPEQVLNSKQVTEKSDLYALGAILYRGVIGRHVFNEPEYEIAQTKLKRDPQPMLIGRMDRVARGLESVVNRAIRRKPSDRYASAREMSVDLEALRSMAATASADDEDTFDRQLGPRAAALVAAAAPTGTTATVPAARVPVAARQHAASARPPGTKTLPLSGRPPGTKTLPLASVSPQLDTRAAPNRMRAPPTPTAPMAPSPAYASRESEDIDLDSIDRLLAAHPSQAPPDPRAPPPEAASGPSLGSSSGSAAALPVAASSMSGLPVLAAQAPKAGGSSRGGRAWIYVLGAVALFAVGAAAGVVVTRRQLAAAYESRLRASTDSNAAASSSVAGGAAASASAGALATGADGGALAGGTDLLGADAGDAAVADGGPDGASSSSSSGASTTSARRDASVATASRPTTPSRPRDASAPTTTSTTSAGGDE